MSPRKANIGILEWLIINKTLEIVSNNNKVQMVTGDLAPAPSRQLPPVPKAFPSQSPAIVPPRPIIKLKVGSQTKSDTSEQPLSKPRPRKIKSPEPPSVSPAVEQAPVDAPPPPYIDDGSHDILQEVLAIEREQDEIRNRLHAERDRDKQPVNGTSGKRKKVDAPSEDDILAFATPSKKERPSPPGPSSSTVNKVKLVVPSASSRVITSSTSKSNTSSIPSSAPNSIPSSHKSKKDKVVESVSTDVPRVSLKGKEKEVNPIPASASSPLPRVKASSKATPINEKKCRDVMKSLNKLPEAAIFSRPVDPIADGCPTYVLSLFQSSSDSCIASRSSSPQVSGRDRSSHGFWHYYDKTWSEQVHHNGGICKRHRTGFQQLPPVQSPGDIPDNVYRRLRKGFQKRVDEGRREKTLLDRETWFTRHHDFLGQGSNVSFVDMFFEKLTNRFQFLGFPRACRSCTLGYTNLL